MTPDTTQATWKWDKGNVTDEDIASWVVVLLLCKCSFLLRSLTSKYVKPLFRSMDRRTGSKDIMCGNHYQTEWEKKISRGQVCVYLENQVGRM